VHESIILLLPPAPALPSRLQYDCNTIAQILMPLRPPICLPYTMQYRAWQYRVKVDGHCGKDRRQVGCVHGPASALNNTDQGCVFIRIVISFLQPAPAIYIHLNVSIRTSMYLCILSYCYLDDMMICMYVCM